VTPILPGARARRPMMIPPGPGRDVFADRGVTFISGANLHDLLIQLYRLRNTQEHLNDFKRVIVAPTPEEFDRRLSRRAYQAEMAALAAYRRLLTNPTLLAHFRSESTDRRLLDARPHSAACVMGGRRSIWTRRRKRTTTSSGCCIARLAASG
jgi:hypothetical protein